MNFGALVKVFDTAVALGTVASRLKSGTSADEVPASLDPQPAPPGVRGYLEAKLTNVLVAALKEAFERDHARLELERAELGEQRRRAERALQAELWRHAAERELGRLKLLAGTALIGWIAAVATLVARLDGASIAARVIMAVAWLLLLGSLGASFTAQARISAYSPEGDAPPHAGKLDVAALWLLVAGLALAAGSVLF